MAGVRHAAGLDEEELHLLRGIGLVLDALRHHEHLAAREMHRAVAKIDAKLPLEDEERLIALRMIVPHEIALELHDLELVVVHLGDDLRAPLLVEERKLLLEIDRLEVHAAPGVLSRPEFHEEPTMSLPLR